MAKTVAVQGVTFQVGDVWLGREDFTITAVTETGVMITLSDGTETSYPADLLAAHIIKSEMFTVGQRPRGANDENRRC